MMQLEARNDFASGLNEGETYQPLFMSQGGLVSSGHFLASLAGDHSFREGGTAIDAGIAAGVALGVLLFDRVNLAGVAPIILYHSLSGRVATIDGLGVWPRRASAQGLREAGAPPFGILRTVTPGAPDAWLTALERFGTLTAGDVLEPAWELCERGAPVSAVVSQRVAAYANPSLWGGSDDGNPVRSSIETFFGGNHLPKVGEIFARPELARVLKAMMDAEATGRREGLDREQSIRRARDVFYRGWVAEELSAFHAKNGGWLRFEDLASYSVEVSEPLRATYGPYEIMTCGPWCQGPLLLQFVNLLEQVDVASMDHNSAEYLHTLLQVMDLGFADREHFYGDPRFVDVPIHGLLTKEYAAERARSLQLGKAFARMPEPGDPWKYQSAERRHTERVAGINPDLVEEGFPQGDTSYVAAVDEDGNIFSATPSDTVFTGPIIPSLGLSCSTRGNQSRAEPHHQNVLAPGKRPRLTPNPALVRAAGRPLMAIGCPGGDAQTQAMLQVFLNLVHFGLSPQQAIEAPRIVSWNFPNSFAPHSYYPGRADIETRIGDVIGAELRHRGHDIRSTNDWDYSGLSAAVHVAVINPENGVLIGGSDPRFEGTSVGWVHRETRTQPTGFHG